MIPNSKQYKRQTIDDLHHKCTILQKPKYRHTENDRN